MIIELKNNLCSAKIQSLGAQLISLKDHNQTEYIWQRDPSVWKECSPILFPIIGNCRNGHTQINGNTYQIPKHGPCKVTDFHLKHQTETSVSFFLTHQDFPEGCYPYEFEFTVHYTLREKTLTFTVEVKNRDEAEMLYCIGLHPGINCPLYEQESFEDYVLEFGAPQTTGYRRYDLEALQFDMDREYPFPGSGCTLPLEKSLFTYDALWFDRPDSRQVSLINPATGKGIRASYPDFETVAFWTLTSPEASYVCIEPWNGSAICSDEDDCFEHKNHVQKLKKSQTGTYTLSLEILN